MDKITWRSYMTDIGRKWLLFVNGELTIFYIYEKGALFTAHFLPVPGCKTLMGSTVEYYTELALAQYDLINAYYIIE